MNIVLIEDDKVLIGSDAVEVLTEIQLNFTGSGINITEEFTAGMVTK